MPQIVALGQLTINDTNDGLSAVLSNEGMSLPADKDGVVSSYAGCLTTMFIYLGGIDDSPNWTVTAAPSTGVQGSFGTGVALRTYTVTSLTANSAYVDFTAKKTGYPDITKRFSLSISKAGIDGEPGQPGSPGTPGAEGLSATRAYCASSTPTTNTAPPATTGKTSVPPANSGGLVGTYSLSTPSLTTGQYMYQTDGSYNPVTNQVTWGIPYWSTLRAGDLSVLSTNTGTLTVSGTISSANGKFSVNSQGQMDARALTLRDDAGNIILSSGTALNPSYAAEGTKNSDIKIGGRNLYPDSGFERGLHPCTEKVSSVTNLKLDGSVAGSVYEGSKSLYFESTGVFTAPATTADTYLYLGGDKCPVVPGVEYVISFYYKSSGIAGFSTYFRTSGSAASSHINIPQTAINVSDKWSRHEQIWICPDGVSFIEARFGMRTATAGSWMAVDCIQVEVGNKATQWVPALEDVEANASAKAEAARVAATATTDLGEGTATFGQRGRNDAPSEYPVGISRQFKRTTAIGVPGVNNFCTLETVKQYKDGTGGGVYQYAYVGLATYRRYAPSAVGDATTWGTWVQDLDRNVYTGDLNASSDISLVGAGTVTLSGNTATKTGTTSAYDGACYSLDSFTGGAYASAKVSALPARMFMGLNTTPTATNSYTDINYAIYINESNNVQVYESNSNKGTYGSAAANDIFVVAYDGANVRYSKNGTVFYEHAVTDSNQTLFFDSSFYSGGSSWSNIKFGPMSSTVWDKLGGVPHASIMNTDDAVALGFNPTFSDWTGTLPAGWGGNAPIKETTLTRIGKYSVKYICDGTANLGINKRVDFKDSSGTYNPLLEGAYLTGSVDVYLEAVTESLPLIIVRLFTDPLATPIIYRDTYFRPTGSVGGWQRLPFTARTLPGERIHGIQVYLFGSYNGYNMTRFIGTAIFDNFRFVINEKSSDPKPVSDAVNHATTGLTSKLNKTGNDTISGTIGLQSAQAILVGNTTNGVYMGSGGLVGRKNGANTFSVTSGGDAYFAGELGANVVKAGSIEAGAITTDKIAAGAITAGKIAAGSIKASSLEVSSDGDSLVKDPRFKDLTWWGREGLGSYSVVDWSSSNTNSGWKSNASMYLYTNTVRDTFTKPFPVVPGATYLLEYQIGFSSDFSGEASVWWYLQDTAWINPSGNNLGTHADGNGEVHFNGTSPKSRQTVVRSITIPEDTRAAICYIRIKDRILKGYLEIGGFTMTRQQDTVLIKDGAITAEKMSLPYGGYINSGQWGFDQGDGFWLQGGDNPRFSIGAGAARMTFEKATGSLKVKGNIEGSAINASVLSINSARILTAGNRLAPFSIYDMGTQFITDRASGNCTVTLKGFVGPMEGGVGIYNAKRFASFKKDIFLKATVTGDFGWENVYIDVCYHDNWQWGNIASATMNCDYKAGFTIIVRYTPADSGWDKIAFRARTTQGKTLTLSFEVNVFNFNESGNAPYSVSNPTNTENDGGGGGVINNPEPWCVDYETARLSDGSYVRDIKVDDLVEVWNDDPINPKIELVPALRVRFGSEQSYLMRSESGAEIIQSRSTPMTLRDGRVVTTDKMLGEDVLVNRSGVLTWEPIVSLEDVGDRRVVKLSLGDRMYFAGSDPKATIATHNMAYQYKP